MRNTRWRERGVTDLRVQELDEFFVEKRAVSRDVPHGVRVFIEVERHTLEGHKHSSCHLFRAKRAKWCRFAGYCTHIGGDIGKNTFGLWADATSAHMAGSAFKKYRK